MLVMLQKPHHAMSIASKIVFQVEKGKFNHLLLRKLEFTGVALKRKIAALKQNSGPQTTAKL